MNAITKLDGVATRGPVPNTIEQWLEVRHWLLPSIARFGGTHTETDVVAMFLAGQLHLWVMPDGAMLTEFIVYPRLKRLSTFAAGGDLEQIMDLKPWLEDFARATGCQQTRIEGRRGWVREHPDYRVLSTILVKDL